MIIIRTEGEEAGVPDTKKNLLLKSEENESEENEREENESEENPQFFLNQRPASTRLSL